jgi:hypothetical protein
MIQKPPLDFSKGGFFSTQHSAFRDFSTFNSHKIGLDEGVDVAIHNGLHGGGLMACAVVLHTPVVEDIGANL